MATASSAGQGLPDEGWDNRQAARGAHMLQSRPWAQFQKELGRELFFNESSDWSWIGYRVTGRGYSYLYIPYGPTVTMLEAVPGAITSIREAAVKARATFVRFEPMVNETSVPATRISGTEHRTPNAEYRAANAEYRIPDAVASAPVQPPRTLIIDLTADETTLRKHLRSGHRNAINRAAKTGLELELATDLSLVEPAVSLLKAASRDRGFRSHGADYYTTMLHTLMPLGFAKIGVARLDGAIISAAVFFDHKGTRAYAHAGNTLEARKAQSSAPLVWHAVMDAKGRGMTVFDLWGIASPDAPPEDPWAGFTEFKRAFGGEERIYAGTFELPVNKLMYNGFRWAKAAANVARQTRARRRG